jgi:hypothetical protein
MIDVLLQPPKWVTTLQAGQFVVSKVIIDFRFLLELNGFWIPMQRLIAIGVFVLSLFLLRNSTPTAPR